jgi:hypothetical protein
VGGEQTVAKVAPMGGEVVTGHVAGIRCPVSGFRSLVAGPDRLGGADAGVAQRRRWPDEVEGPVAGRVAGPVAGRVAGQRVVFQGFH